MNEKCFICAKHQGEIKTSGITIYEDDYVYVGHIDSNDPLKYIGYLMITMKKSLVVLRKWLKL